MAMQNVSRFGGRSGRSRHGEPVQRGCLEQRGLGAHCHRPARMIRNGPAAIIGDTARLAIAVVTNS